jgi:hypothetical protein
MADAYHGTRIDVHHHFYAPEDLGAIYRGNVERLLPRFALTAAT